MINYITYGGKSLRDFNLYVNGGGTYNAPAKVYTTLEIPGRSGLLLYDEKRFENIEVTYPSAFINPNFETNIAALRDYLYSLSGYQRLEDTYHPNEYRMAYYTSGLEVSVDMLNKFGVFDLVFNCKPQRFLKSGETLTKVYLKSSGDPPIALTNPTSYNSKPLIRLYGTGEVGINGSTITLTDNSSYYTFIDCESMEIYRSLSNPFSANDKVILSDYKFPELVPGVNNFTAAEGITQIYIRPRWWTI